MAGNLIDAVVAQLRGSPCAAMFGDTYDPDTEEGVIKFAADYAAEPTMPFLVIFEPNEDHEYMTASGGNYRPFIATGSLTMHVRDEGREQASLLGDQVRDALNDAALVWPGQNLMLFRLRRPSFIPQPSTGPSSPSVFVRQLVFDYQYSGAI